MTMEHTQRFACIVLPEGNSRLKPLAQTLGNYAHEVRTFTEAHRSQRELIDRVADADCILPMGGTRLDADLLEACPRLRYIGLGATLFHGESSNIDLQTARRRGIVVTGARDYGDIGVAEWVAAVAVKFLKQPHCNGELAGTVCGVVGAGASGSLTARTLAALGAEVHYFSRSRKADLDAAGIGFLELAELLRRCRVVSIHLPRRVHLIGREELSTLGNDKLLLNTSVGLPVEERALRSWIEQQRNIFAADADGIGELADIARTHPHIEYLDASAGYTRQAEQRLFAQVESRLREFLLADRSTRSSNHSSRSN